MAPLLYLDTARLGQMTPAAKDAQLDFVRLSAEEPSSLYFEEFLRGGYSAWPTSYQQRFPGLRTWHGVAALKQSLRRLAGAPDDWPVLLASRSLSLVQLAARSMFRVCRNVLTTDLSWPTYQQAVETKARRTGNRITTVPIRDEILYRGWSADDVASHLATAFEEHRCDGLFLPAVDHLGIRLPIRKIVNRIRERNELRFCFTDAAQAFCHVPLDEWFDVADFIVAGSHKWMGAYLPMGIGLFGQRRSQDVIDRISRMTGDTALINDPLYVLTEQLESRCLDGVSETVNLAPMMSCAGALSDQLHRGQFSEVDDDTAWNAALHAPQTGDWQPLKLDPSLCSRIVLFQSLRAQRLRQRGEDSRREWLQNGAIVTGYDSGIVRTSWPVRESVMC